MQSSVPGVEHLPLKEEAPLRLSSAVPRAVTDSAASVR